MIFYYARGAIWTVFHVSPSKRKQNIISCMFICSQLKYTRTYTHPMQMFRNTELYYYANIHWQLCKNSVIIMHICHTFTRHALATELFFLRKIHSFLGFCRAEVILFNENAQEMKKKKIWYTSALPMETLLPPKILHSHGNYENHNCKREMKNFHIFENFHVIW